MDIVSPFSFLSHFLYLQKGLNPFLGLKWKVVDLPY